ncbi:WXG100-like domain-containing protein [Streptomyces albus]
MPPDELVGFLNFLGLDWPTANEDELFRVAELYVLIAEDYRALQEALTEVSGRVGEEFEGAAAQAFLKLVGKLDNGEAPALEAGASQSLQLSEVAHATGVDVEHSKLAAIMELVSMFVEFLVSAAFTYFLGPAFAAMLSMRFLATRSVILALLRRVVFAIAAQSAIGAGVETALELLVQAIQIDKGHRDTIDWDLVGQSAAAGAIGGAIAAPLDAAGMAFAKWLGNQIGSGVKQTLGKSLRDVFTGPLPADVGKAAASRPGKTAASHAAAPDAKSATGPLGLPHQDAERFADDLGGVLTDVHAHFSKGLYKDGVPDDVTQTFAKNVAKVFDKHLSPVLPDGAAGRLGHDWAKTLSTGWGNDAASRDLVKDRLGELARAAGLDRQAAHTLARDVPDSLAKVLDTPPGGWRHSALEFTTGTLMDGVTNVLTEGTVAAVFEGEFSVDGGSFLAGAAMGGLARGTLALGGAAYDGAGQALSWFRGGDDAGPAATSLDPMKPGGDLKPDPPVTDPGQLNVTGPVVGEPALPGTGTGQGTETTVGTATVGQAPAPPATQSTSTHLHLHLRRRAAAGVHHQRRPADRGRRQGRTRPVERPHDRGPVRRRYGAARAAVRSAAHHRQHGIHPPRPHRLRRGRYGPVPGERHRPGHPADGG